MIGPLIFVWERANVEPCESSLEGPVVISGEKRSQFGVALRRGSIAEHMNDLPGASCRYTAALLHHVRFFLPRQRQSRSCVRRSR